MGVKIESTDQALRLMRDVRNDKGHDYRYITHVEADQGSKECRYFEGSTPEDVTPGCIVGHVLHKLGYEPTFQSDFYDQDRLVRNDGIEGQDATGLVSMHVIDASEEVGLVLKAAQMAQDQGMTWTQAINQADLVKRALEFRRPAAA